MSDESAPASPKVFASDESGGSEGTAKVQAPRKPFRHLFSREELTHYGLAAAVYILLGVLLKSIVLNWIVGPLFIVVWMWLVPPLVDRWRGRIE